MKILQGKNSPALAVWGVVEPSIEAWKKYLRNDPTRFLLDANAPPSIHLWYALDIANRPEDAPAVVELRERVLYSDTVQAILAAQHPDGYWDNAASLTEPRYRATIWNLALLAELGIPHNSRRARQAIEFVVENMDSKADGLEMLADGLASAHFFRGAVYFNRLEDDSVLTFAKLFRDAMDLNSLYDALALLWASSKWRGELRERSHLALDKALDVVLDQLEHRAESSPLTFPQFDTDDDLFILRVLAEHHRANDPRAERALIRLVAQQDAYARWSVEDSLDDRLITPLPDAPDASYWLTLNAARVIKSIIAG